MRDPEGVVVLRKKLAARLVALRSAAGLTQEDAAEEAGITERHLRRIERGKANVTIGTLHALTIAYGAIVRIVLARPKR